MPLKEVKSHSSDNPTLDLTTVRVMDGLRRLVRALSTSARGTTGQGDVSGAQRFVLQQIAAAPGLSIGELAARTLSRQSTVSEVVARLVERGFIKREANSADARQTSLTLTSRGHRVIVHVEPTAQERLADGLGMLPHDMRIALADGLEAWLSTAGLMQVPATMFFEEDDCTPSVKRRNTRTRNRSQK